VMCSPMEQSIIITTPNLKESKPNG
jgi:hypothetical protein